VLRLAGLTVAAAGCLPSVSALDQGPLTETFAVSDYFTPSGYMGDGETFGKLIGGTNEGCKPRVPGARGNCYEFTYWPGSMGWAGVYWVFPANSWGSAPGRRIDASRFKQVSFWAAVDGPTPFTVDMHAVGFGGGVGHIDPKGSYAARHELEYVDGVSYQMAWTVGDAEGVASDMRPFHITLDDSVKHAGCSDPSKVVGTNFVPNCTGGQAEYDAMTSQASFLIGAFEWDLAYPKDAIQCVDGSTDCLQSADPSKYASPQPVHVYLDDIVWSTEDPPVTP
jgi:hypothetical protein